MKLLKAELLWLRQTGVQNTIYFFSPPPPLRQPPYTVRVPRRAVQFTDADHMLKLQNPPMNIYLFSRQNQDLVNIRKTSILLLFLPDLSYSESCDLSQTPE